MKRIVCSYNPVGTRQGRLSSSQTIFETGGNLQNQPPKMKDIMIADDGYMVVNMDLSQAENRIVARLAREEKMIEAFDSGKDIHRLTAALIFDKNPEDISDEKGSCEIGGGEQSERDWGKRANHSLNYGIGAYQFSMYYEIPENEAKFLINAYHRAYPGISRWHREIQFDLRHGAELINPFGRKYRFLDRWGDEMFKQAYSFIPQSTVADIINDRGILKAYTNNYPFYDVELLNQVHDSIVFQHFAITKEDRLLMARAIIELKKSLEKPIEYKDQTFIIPTDLGVGFNCGKKSDKNPNGLREFKSHEYTETEQLARHLDEIYGEHRAT